MRINLIGAGNVATHMGVAFREAGHTVCGVFSRTAGSARTLAQKVGARPTTVLEELPEAELYLFAVKDDALPALARQLTDCRPAALPVHTAGSVPMSVFDGLSRHHGVIYPLQTLSKAKSVLFREVPCFVEASDAETEQVLLKLANDISGKVQILDSERRARLHLAAVFASNFVNHCYAIAEQWLREEHLDETLIYPLIQETANKALQARARDVQTGPAVRYDRRVLQKQEEMLARDPLRQKIYELMSLCIHDYAQQQSDLTI